MYQSKGILKYSTDPLKLVVEADPEIAAFYRALIPKWKRYNQPRYAAHISVVRNELPLSMDVWGKYENQEISFDYSGVVREGVVYFWLDVYCRDLEDIRAELGLSVSSEITRPPDSFKQCFHMTIANKK